MRKLGVEELDLLFQIPSVLLEPKSFAEAKVKCFIFHPPHFHKSLVNKVLSNGLNQLNQEDRNATFWYLRCKSLAKRR